MSQVVGYCGLSVRERCRMLLDYADNVSPVEQPDSGSLGEWHLWDQARRIRAHVGDMLSAN